MLKFFLEKKTTYPKRVDEAAVKDNIADLFKDKFCNLYNSVPYNNNEMIVLINDIDNLIESKCNSDGIAYTILIV